MTREPTDTAPEGSEPEQGLRERKKREMRRLIAETARKLFAERGFEAVTVAEVARAADVSEKTVFNYFQAKEDLFYSRLEAFGDEMAEAVRERSPGTGFAEALGEFLLRDRGVFGIRSPGDDAEEATNKLRAITRVITESPALLARERQIHDDYARSLAALFAEETGAKPGDIRPQVAATALIGLHRAMIDYVRERTLAGDSAGTIAKDVRAEGKRAFKLLDGGLAGYGARRARRA